MIDAMTSLPLQRAAAWKTWEAAKARLEECVENETRCSREHTFSVDALNEAKVNLAAAAKALQDRMDAAK